jgi:quercetin dioxygenase-like cupin family protein
MKNTSLPLKAFKRFTSLERSKWYMGMLLTNLTETPDTNGAFSLFEATLAPGTEPPPHVHSGEDELFYVLEGEFDVYVGEEVFNGKTGECIFLPRFKPHAFIIRSPRLRLLIFFAPAGVEEAFRSMSSPAQNLNPPMGALTYSAEDLEQTAQRFSASGVRMLAPDEIEHQVPLYPKSAPAIAASDEVSEGLSSQREES